MSKYKTHLQSREFVISTIVAFGLLLVSLVINFYAGAYATEKASNAVTDVVLSNIRVYDVDGFFVYGALLFWVFIAWLLIREPNRIPFTLKAIALFTLIRSLFISLTHMGPFPERLEVNSNFMGKFTSGGDLFFSGHTGLPFLMALVFWNTKPLRYLFIASSMLFGAVVLMAHLHYSIDVLSAFFITYSIYHIAEIIFRTDKLLFLYGLKRE